MDFSSYNFVLFLLVYITLQFGETNEVRRWFDDPAAEVQYWHAAGQNSVSVTFKIKKKCSFSRFLGVLLSLGPSGLDSTIKCNSHLH